MSDDTKTDHLPRAMSPHRRTKRGRKLLVATLGVALLSVVGAGCSSGNLLAPPDARRPDAGDDDSDTDAAAEDR